MCRSAIGLQNRLKQGPLATTAETTCAWCGRREHKYTAAKVRSGRGKTCSLSCAAALGNYERLGPLTSELVWHDGVPRAARRLRHRQRRAALVASSSAHHTRGDRIAQRLRQGGRCYWCGKTLGRIGHADHVVPLALGGSDAPENIVISCPECNALKSSKHPMDFAGVLF